VWIFCGTLYRSSFFKLRCFSCFPAIGKKNIIVSYAKWRFIKYFHSFLKIDFFKYNLTYNDKKISCYTDWFYKLPYRKC
jgi:hypothetical protein